MLVGHAVSPSTIARRGFLKANRSIRPDRRRPSQSRPNRPDRRRVCARRATPDNWTLDRSLDCWVWWLARRPMRSTAAILTASV